MAAGARWRMRPGDLAIGAAAVKPNPNPMTASNVVGFAAACDTRLDTVLDNRVPEAVSST